ncbi:MAG TPA: hypothetical protein VIV63_09205, partial [Steroidobacteraceae bacterium]
MRRLTLILSDLYLPEETERGAAVPAARDLPNLEWLMRFAGSPHRIGDWRAWLMAQTAPGFGSFPLAVNCAYGRIDDGLLDSTWLATPVALEARLDHVRLLDRGLLRLEEAERASCREEFARVFGPKVLLHEGGERGFFLSGLPAAGVNTVDPARLLGTEIGPAMPGREAGELRRLWTEIEMWLHGAAFNTQRERARKPRVSALWLWGARSTPETRGRVEAWRASAAYFGGDPLIAALARCDSHRARGVPKQWAHLDAAEPHVVVEFAALTGGPHESLEALDANWFAPAKAALATGDLAELDL